MTSSAQPRESVGNALFFGRDGLRAGWGILAFLIIFRALLLGLAPLARMLHHRSPLHRLLGETPFNVLVLEAYPFFAALLAAFALSRIEKRPVPQYGLGRPRFGQFAVGACWGVLQLSLLVAILWRAHLLVFDARLLFGAQSVRYALEWAAAFLFVALFEEYLLRGYLQFTLARGIAGMCGEAPWHRTAGFWIAAVALSCLFGFGHHSNRGESPIGLVAAGLFGLVFCLSLWRTGSLWWAVGWHAAWDWAQSFLFGVADSGMVTQHHLLQTHPQGAAMLSGGLTGPEGSVYVLPVVLLTVLILLLTLPAERRWNDAA